ncbi:MAG: class I SAM-dependent methyltransferase family protein [Thermoproteota archaeon]|nr:class I SAM-dependent methyltransferase family protein [Thermoproteota archaeon]
MATSEAVCLQVPKVLGEKAILLLSQLNLLNRDLKIDRVNNYLHVPLVRKLLPSDLETLRKNLSEFEVATHVFSERSKRPLNIVDALENRLPPHLLASLPQSVDFVGDIAVLQVPPELKEYEEVIGKALLTVHKRLRTVLAKAGAVEGVYRIREFEVIAGEEKTKAVHREHKCVYHVDLAKVYFSPRLSHEHNRVAQQVREGETVVDMFAGVGPFSILIAKRRRDVQVYAVDMNPNAVQLLEKNLAVNHVAEKVTPILGDAKQIVQERLRGIADRVIMNLPERAIEFVDATCEALKPEGGIIHYYEFTHESKPLETAKVRLTEAVKQAGREVEKVLLARVVRGIAPYAWQVVVDAEIQ